MPSIISGNDNFNTASSLGVRAQVFTSSGTFTVPLGVSAVKVTVIGGGGGGGGATRGGSGTPNQVSGGGGGAGVTTEWVTGLTQSSTVSVTVGAAGAGGAAGATGGAGGTSSFGAYCSATGGGGGLVALPGAGGAAGTGVGGDINSPGGAGQIGNPNTARSGAGGGLFYGLPFIATETGAGCVSILNYVGNGSQYGKGADGVATNNNGLAGVGYGTGGSGASRISQSGSHTGGAGAVGLVIVEW
jgi:hypothetical protein